jgi:mono/diheme cytochrome c family protein
MKTSILIAAAIAATAGFAGSALAADAAAGKAKVEGICIDCHEDGKNDEHFKGKSAAQLEAAIKDVVAGKVKHKKKNMPLTDADIANIAAYLSSK